MRKATIYGYRNTAAFNRDPQGDESWFSTREARDAALEAFRSRMVDRGLSVSASVSGIRPIKGPSADHVGVMLRDVDLYLEEVL